MCGYLLHLQNFLIDTTGHIKLTDFGLAAGALNPGKIEHLKHKVSRSAQRPRLETQVTLLPGFAHSLLGYAMARLTRYDPPLFFRPQLDEVADSPLVYRSTLEMKSIYKTLRLADARYADSVVGSPDYMAIETLRGQSYSYSVDYWSLGCILFECVPRCLPSRNLSSSLPCDDVDSDVLRSPERTGSWRASRPFRERCRTRRGPTSRTGSASCADRTMIGRRT